MKQKNEVKKIPEPNSKHRSFFYNHPKPEANIAVFQANIWHARLGHPSNAVLKHVMKSMNFVGKIKNSICDACKDGKMHTLPFTQHTISVKEPLEILYSGIWGPSPLLSTQGHKYYILFVDSYSRYTWLFPLKQKLEAPNIFKHFKKNIELPLGRKIKALHSDMG